MLNSSDPTGSPRSKLNQLAVKIVNSTFVGWLANLPIVAALIRRFTQRLAHSYFSKITEANYIENYSNSSLDQIVIDVVNELDYVGAMLATYEQGDALPVRAFHIQKHIPIERIEEWEKSISKLIDPKFLKHPELPISISNFKSPNIAQVFVYDQQFENNLSVKAAQTHTIVTSDDLYDLFRPIAPAASRNIIKGIQQELRIKQVIAIPFFLNNGEMVGNLFVASSRIIDEKDISILKAFTKQASAAIEGERYRLQANISQQMIFQLQENISDEAEILQQITQGVVKQMQYIGAMVATYEQDGALPIRAFYINPQIATLEQVRGWERKVSPLVDPEFLSNPDLPISISDPNNPNIGRVFVQNEKYNENLSVKAVRKKGISFGESLYELFTPITPVSSKPIIYGIQEELGIKKVIAVPFFLGDKLIGNLFAASRSRSFRQSEIDLLEAFGQQAAAGIRNARLYRRSEHRRETSEKFGKMAFSASANVHALRNLVGAASMHLQLLNLYRTDPEKLNERLDSNQDIIKKLKEAAVILDKLHEPWHQQLDSEVNLNISLGRALNNVNDRLNLDEHIKVTVSYGENLPRIMTSQDMLTEAFKILLKNGMEAILEKNNLVKMEQDLDRSSGLLHVETRFGKNSNIEVLIQDDGIGIASENLSNLFELNWSTKEEGLGFGLFWLRDYIEGLGGTIVVESKLHKGTKFLLNLPIKITPNPSLRG